MRSKTCYREYSPKTILNVHRHCDGGWFWDKYSVFPYAGCEWGCRYCYWRDAKYSPHKASKDPLLSKFDDPFSQYVKVKKNAPELLRRALKNKAKDLVYLDSYQPVDSEYQYTRRILEICLELGFPVFLNEKSPMILRDLDVLREIAKISHLNVGWSIITNKDDRTRIAFEPEALPVSSRFAAMKKLADNGILTGTVLMPILPYIYDDEENIETVIKKTKDSGGQYVLDGGLTLQGNCGLLFNKALGDYDPTLSIKYEKLYGSPIALVAHNAEVHHRVLNYCQEYGLRPHIPRPIDFYPERLQINKKIAEKFYLQARELQLSSLDSYKEWAYRRAAWALDDLEDSVRQVYQDKGIAGLMKINGIGKSLSQKIAGFLESGIEWTDPTLPD